MSTRKLISVAGWPQSSSTRATSPRTVNTTGAYNHYSALRSYEDLLVLTSGGDDGYGHLGFAADAGLLPFGPDVFTADRE